MRVCTPLLILGPRSRREEGNIVTGVLFTLFATFIIVCPSRGVEVWSHLYGAVRCCVFRTTEMEHVYRLGIQ